MQVGLRTPQRGNGANLVIRTHVKAGGGALDLARVEPVPAARKRILLVEGDGFTRLVLLLRLRLAGFGVDFTSNGILGLGKLRTCHPDILLVELKLCGLSGLELIKAARAEPGFGDRPIYVFTQADRMNRATRKEVGLLATEVFDKESVTREDLVQIFASTLLDRQNLEKQSAPEAAAQGAAPTLSELALSGAIEELIAGVREQAELFGNEKGDRVASGAELLSRVSSLASCAKAAGLADLARHAKALEKFLNELCRNKPGGTESAARTVTQAVEVMSGMPFQNAGQEQGPHRFRVVYVDEASDSSQAMREALLEAAFDPMCFEDPGQARDYLASNRTDLVIANVALPEAHALAVQDVRQLPLQLKTPVLFGPESVFAAMRGELPTSAPRLDGAPFVRAEFVVRALNEVQRGYARKPVRRVAAEPPVKAVPQPFSRSAAAASLPVEDGFELFARTPRPAQGAAVSTAAIQPPRQFDEAFSAAGIPAEPILRVQPGLLEADPQAEVEAILPAGSSDEMLLAEAPLEAAPPSAFEAEPPPVAEPDSAVADQGAEVNWLGAADNNVSQSQTDNAVPDLQPNRAAPVQDAALSTNYGETMINQLQEAPAEFVPADTTGEPAEALNGQAHQRDDLAARVCAAEMALYHAQKELEQKDQALQALHERLAEEQGKPTAPSSESNAQAQARCAELEQEVSALRQAFAGLGGNNSEPQVGSDTGKPVQPASPPAAPNEAEAEELKELEQQVSQGVAALARATAELARERGERQRCQHLATDLNGRLQAVHVDLSKTLAAQGEHLGRISALEQQQHQAEQALERANAELEQQQAERRQAEAQLQKTKDANAQLRKDLSFFEDANNKFDGARQELQSRLENNLNASRDSETRLQQEKNERERLAASLEEARRDLQNQSRKREILEQELQGAREALQEREARLQKETAERQRLNQARECLQNGLQDSSERDLEFSKLKSALQLEQIERKRQETQLARTRQRALDAVHAARALRASLRRQVREPVDNLVHSSRSLLELELSEQQKKLAESVLQDVLLVQTRLGEPGVPPADPAEPPAPSASSDS